MRMIPGLIASLVLLGCTSDPVPLSNRDTAVAALEAVYVDKDVDAIDVYFDPAFVRHDPAATADGTAAFKAQVSPTLPNISFHSFRAYEQGDQVVVHDEYDDVAAGTHTIAFDLFRIADGMIVEHWTCTQADLGTYASGHTMVDGPTMPDPAVSTGASVDTVATPGTGFVPVVIIGGAFDRLAEFLQPTFAQHDPLIADGIMGLGAAFAQPPLVTLRVLSIPQSVGEDDFVFTRSQSTMTWDAAKPNSPDNPTVTCDLFRVQDGVIAEHWDVIQLDPNSSEITDLRANGAGHTLWN